MQVPSEQPQLTEVPTYPGMEQPGFELPSGKGSDFPVLGIEGGARGGETEVRQVLPPQRAPRES